MRITGLLLLFLLAMTACTSEEVPRKTQSDSVSKNDPTESIESIVSSEELILALTPELRRLNKSLANLQVPDEVSKELFSENVEVAARLAASKSKTEIIAGISTQTWDVSDSSKTVARTELVLWEPLFSNVRYVKHGKFYFVSGTFADRDRTEYQSNLGGAGSAVLSDGSILGWSAKIEATWSRVPNEDVWTISKWKTKSFSTTAAVATVFVDVLADVIEDDAIYSLATTSLQDQKTSDLFAGTQPHRLKGDTYPFFFSEVTLEHPSVAIVDIDADGYDDVFVAMQHSRNLLFRNKQDGTLEECADRFGLHRTANCSAALFADFDNDGDPDLFLGRPRHRGQFLLNNSGTFEDRTDELIGVEMPFMISSISAADYNGDGLLDVHFSTYGPLEHIHLFSANESPIWAQQYLSAKEFSTFKKQLAETHAYLRRPGPPNLLLVNVGGGAFDVARENEQLQLWRQSFQATWNDFDRDGDPDLYVANDYGPDNFLRNDFPNGFTDITDVSGIEIGFGMGVTWNDYNNDGFSDLYVSNMFSKAGRRITANVAEIDPQFKRLATGNYLYRGDGEKFELVSGTDSSSLQVAKAGWAWGGQFIDINNDGFSDIYSPNGYYTAPADIAMDMDL